MGCGTPAGAAGEALGVGQLARDVHAPQAAGLHAEQALVQARHDLRAEQLLVGSRAGHVDHIADTF